MAVSDRHVLSRHRAYDAAGCFIPKRSNRRMVDAVFNGGVVGMGHDAASAIMALRAASGCQVLHRAVAQGAKQRPVLPSGGGVGVAGDVVDLMIVPVKCPPEGVAGVIVGVYADGRPIGLRCSQVQVTFQAEIFPAVAHAQVDRVPQSDHIIVVLDQIGGAYRTAARPGLHLCKLTRHSGGLIRHGEGVGVGACPLLQVAVGGVVVGEIDRFAVDLYTFKVGACSRCHSEGHALIGVGAVHRQRCLSRACACRFRLHFEGVLRPEICVDIRVLGGHGKVIGVSAVLIVCKVLFFASIVARPHQQLIQHIAIVGLKRHGNLSAGFNAIAVAVRYLAVELRLIKLVLIIVRPYSAGLFDIDGQVALDLPKGHVDRDIFGRHGEGIGAVVGIMTYRNRAAALFCHSDRPDLIALVRHGRDGDPLTLCARRLGQCDGAAAGLCCRDRIGEQCELYRYLHIRVRHGELGIVLGGIHVPKLVVALLIYNVFTIRFNGKVIVTRNIIAGIRFYCYINFPARDCIAWAGAHSSAGFPCDSSGDVPHIDNQELLYQNVGYGSGVLLAHPHLGVLAEREYL